jgi:hypothetical protein
MRFPIRDEEPREKTIPKNSETPLKASDPDPGI